jgi:hypothetical protein
MIFPVLVLLSALLIEGIGTYISVIGLSTLFAANAVIIGLAIALDVAKLATVSFLYKHWDNLGLLMRTYMTIAAVVLMTITSSGAFGYLSGQFQKAIAGSSQDTIIIQSLNEEKSRLSARKVEIDSQIARLPDNSVNGRTQLLRQFGPEVGRINKRLEAIEVQLPQLKVDSLKKNTEVGPIIYIATAFHTTPEEAVKWVILTIIFVFDPLAVALLVAANFLFELHRKKFHELEKDVAAFKLERHQPANPPSTTKIEAVHQAEPVAIDRDAYGADLMKADEMELHKLAEESLITNNVEPISTATEQPPEPREIITKEQITGVKHRSSLEDVDGAKGDVEVQGTPHPIHNRALYGVYTESTPDAVTVGGPVGR